MIRFWKKNEKIANVLKCLLVSYIMTGIFILILAFLLYKFSLPKQVIGIASDIARAPFTPDETSIARATNPSITRLTIVTLRLLSM